MRVALLDHAPPRPEQEGGKNIEDPREILDEHRTGGDEDAAKNQGSQDAQEQHPMLKLAGHAEEAEDDGPDKEVVDGQRLLDQIAGEVLLSESRPPGGPDDDSEQHAEGHPDR